MSFRAIRISERVYWVGAIDWGLRDFHGYATSRGTTYNAYLVMTDKVTLIDTVKAHLVDEMYARIATVVDPSRIEYIVSNHSEMDHSGGLPAAIARLKPARVFASVMGKKALAAHFRGNPDMAAVTEVKTGDEIDLGGDRLRFVETRMLHWPDSMVSWLPGEKVLFSQDAFGMHLASGERFDDELPLELLEHEARKYYANILLPYSPLIAKVLEDLDALGIAPALVAPDHGPVWRKHFAAVAVWYGTWAAQRPERRAVITYDTMWKSTESMARAIADGVSSEGAAVKVMPLAASHRSDVATELLCAGGFAVGSPTLNNNLFPTVADVLCYLKGLKPKNLSGFAFGSYGWSGEGLKLLDELLPQMGVDLLGPALKCVYVPDDGVLQSCFERGRELGQKLATL